MQNYIFFLYFCIFKKELKLKHRHNMKQKLSLVALAVVLLFAGCMKDGDFDELNHPMRVQGEFDPTYGFPVAWADADLGTLLGFVPSGAKFNILVDSASGLLSLEKDSVLHNCYTFDSKKGDGSMPKAGKDGKTRLFHREIVHGNKIGLEDLKKHDMVIKRLDLYLMAYVKAEMSGSTRALLESDAEIYFDTIRMTIDFEDGTTFKSNLYWDAHVSASELVEGKSVLLVEYDASPWVNREAKRVHFSTAVNVAATPSSYSAAYLKDSLHIDSLIVDCHALVDFPAIMYVGNLNEIDTMAADMSAIDSILNSEGVSEEGVTISLNDTATNYLYIQADNGLPVNLIAQLRGLDSNYNDMTGDLLPDQSFFVASPVEEVPDDLSSGLYEGYMASGRTASEIRISITTAMLRNLAKSKYLELKLHATTPTELPPVGDEAKPFVIIRNTDRVKLKVSLKVSPHIQMNIPISNSSNK